jgi:hypothetical protein
VVSTPIIFRVGPRPIDVADPLSPVDKSQALTKLKSILNRFTARSA